MKMSRLLSLVLSLAMVLGLTVSHAFAQNLDEGPQLDSTKDYYALMVTNQGNIRLKLRPDRAAVAVRNFVNLAEGTRQFKDAKGEVAKRPYYNGVIFHRVGPNFMIQGGDPTGTGAGGPGYSIVDEYDANDVYDKGGYLAMARTNAPNSGGSQFFITEGPSPGLTGGYTIFGEIAAPEDLDIVKKIARVPLARKGGDGTGKPAKDVTIERIDIIRVAKGAPVADVFKAEAKKPEAAAPAAAAPASAAPAAATAPEKKDPAPAPNSDQQDEKK